MTDYTLPDIPEVIESIDELTPETWRDFDDLSTNSLWMIPSRSKVGAHDGSYHGNFVPQIPYQLIRRFTKPGDVVLDPFLGSGTTLIEARRLGRHGIGVELNSDAAAEADRRIYLEFVEHDVWHRTINADSTDRLTKGYIKNVLNHFGCTNVQLTILHPPYHDIIKFSDDPRDLSNVETREEFLSRMNLLAHYIFDLIAPGGFLALVMGDKYENGEWIPLAFQTAEAIQEPGYKLKSIVVKNMEGNRAKRNQERLWRYRALKGNFYVFKHEYIFLFQKTKEK